MYPEFKARAEAVSAEVARFATTAEAVESLVTFLQAEGAAAEPGGWAVWAPGALLSTLDRGELLKRSPALCFEVTRERAAQARIGISQVDAAAAATGTLLQDATSIEQRLVSTLPLIHVALLSTHSIAADWPTALRRFDPRRAGYLAAITGPSRTADIERVLTIGVHGPKRLVIYSIDDLAVSEAAQ